MTARTPRPWSAFSDDTESGFGFGHEREWDVPMFRLYDGTPEQIDYVVAALNAHDDLVAALRELDANLENHQDSEYCRYQRRTIRAALAKAGAV